MKPTTEQVERAGDVILECLQRQTLSRFVDGCEIEPRRGDLVVEVSNLQGDWEAVGYLLSEPKADPIVLWSLLGRVVRWTNARVYLIGRGNELQRHLPRPSRAQLAAEGLEDPWTP